MSGADEKIRAVLEWLVQDLDIEQSERLAQRLWPILLAGQAMYEELGDNGGHNPESCLDGKCPICWGNRTFMDAWDAALNELTGLAAAQGQPEKESGR